MSFFEKLKNRWGVKNNVQVIIILVVFACTGFSVLGIKPYLQQIVGHSRSAPWHIQLIFYLFIFFPAYQVLLLIYAFIFRQFSFFWNFISRMNKRLLHLILIYPMFKRTNDG